MDFEKTRAWIAETSEKGWQPGAQVFVARRGAVLLDEAFGNAMSGSSMQPDSLNLWFSSGKPITAVALAQLEEEGKVGWDDPVRRWIPAFGSHGKEAVTLRHVLTHTGGFRVADAIPEATPWAETIERICSVSLEPNATPGEFAAYHTHSSWAVLAEVIQRAADEPFEDVIKNRVFRPAGMDESHVRLSPEKFEAMHGRLAHMHMTDRGQVDGDLFWNTAECANVLRPGAFLRGPIRDLGRFYGALLEEPSPLLRRETIDLMTRRHRERKFDDTFKHVIDFGFGFIINSRRYGVETVPYGFGRHAGENAFGHGGQQTSCAFADPESGVVVAWVFNGLPGVRIHHKRGRELNTAIYEDLGILRED